MTDRRVPLPVALVGLVAVVSTAAGAGSQSNLIYPVDVFVDDDRMIIADFKVPGVLSVDRAGNVDALARGEGRPRTPLYGTRAVHAAPDGDGWLVADPGTFALYRIRSNGEVDLVTNELDIPQGIVRFDDDSVLVSDLRAGIGAIMRVTLAGEVSVFAEIASPKGIVADGPDGFAVVSTGERAVYRVRRDGGVETLFRGAPLEFPQDLARLDDGTLVVSDGYASALFRLSPDGRITALTSGAPLVAPQGIAITDTGLLVVVDPQAGALFRITLDGAVELWVEAGAGR